MRWVLARLAAPEALGMRIDSEIPKGKGFERACLRAVSVSFSSERN